MGPRAGQAGAVCATAWVVNTAAVLIRQTKKEKRFVNIGVSMIK
jgi:hypothetical protein